MMPAYPWLAEREANEDADIQLKMIVLRKLGYPYTDEEIDKAPLAYDGRLDDTQVRLLVALLVQNASP